MQKNSRADFRPAARIAVRSMFWWSLSASPGNSGLLWRPSNAHAHVGLRVPDLQTPTSRLDLDPPMKDAGVLRSATLAVRDILAESWKAC